MTENTAPASEPQTGDAGAGCAPEARNPVGWFEIYVQDMPRAKAFYQAVFGIEFSPLESPGVELWAFPGNMTSYGITGALVRMEGVSSGGNSVLVYFSCKDCAEEGGRAVAAGGQLFKPKMSIGQYGFIALIGDSEGNMIGLHSMQ